ncbi:hypothetical protein DKY63_14385 [Pseudomonas putida]|uniref:Uncharacterized protein n=1 Tax=Pseudomonas putida TaxID=303 RepID=A0A2Z4RIS4_PSEPU|nr:hypothetical protein [Pseudomonas putida]AWY41010.1 hypothetical protein DKY63_14385 [Pseudomonas putida]
MTKLKKRMSNPMTIIATFATLSETSAAISLPFLDNDEREIYVWFLISFPFYLLFLFFATLNFNYRSLYSPSDFEKDEHFLKAMDEVDPPPGCASVQDPRSGDFPCRAQAPPDETDLHYIALPKQLKGIHIIDTRWMKSRREFKALLGKTRKPQEGKAQVIVFLTDNALENPLGDSVTEFSRQNNKRGRANCCVAYDLNSQRATVMDWSPLANTQS